MRHGQSYRGKYIPCEHHVYAQLMLVAGFWLELNRNTIKSLERLASQTGDMQRMVEEAIGNMQEPPGMLDRIKSNLGPHEDLKAHIEVATEEYNIAVCQQLVTRPMRLPRERRDLVYQYLVPNHVGVYIILTCQPELHIHNLVDTGYDYFADTQALHVPASPPTRNGPVCSEPFWRDKTLGVTISHELAESFYQYRTFDVWTIGNRPAHATDHRLRSALHTDRFGVGIDTADLISRFSLVIWFRYAHSIWN
ncbi:hypothetical protein BDU57DRAFT_344699 [Ampelomyces quisqualis]|uniref:Uncharacterized protein n=1 Tax=Ampelomyces quisqualis TaxID=50730 RepID=A0A6A5QCK1_AMPQU|nr:hypothetical protein BDU57DRAFT_344699 [Ampelomyces quisqualis]